MQQELAAVGGVGLGPYQSAAENYRHRIRGRPVADAAPLDEVGRGLRAAAVEVTKDGGLTEPQAIEGADAVLVTHEHADHFNEERLRRAMADNPA